MAELGLPAARCYAKIAPAAPHALHMPSHIFARLGMWQQDIDSNLASIAASRNAAATHMGDEGHEYHAMEFLIYAYLQSGRDVEAQQLIEEVRSLPKMKDMYGVDFDPQISALTSFSAAYALELHHWKEAEALPLISTVDDADASITYKARAIGAARSGDLPAARANLQAIQDLHGADGRRQFHPRSGTAHGRLLQEMPSGRLRTTLPIGAPFQFFQQQAVPVQRDCGTRVERRGQNLAAYRATSHEGTQRRSALRVLPVR